MKLVTLSVGTASIEIEDLHLFAFLQFVGAHERELGGMLRDVLLKAPYGSRARETAQIFQRFVEDSKSRNEPVLIEGIPIEKYLADSRRSRAQ